MPSFKIFWLNFHLFLFYPMSILCFLSVILQLISCCNGLSSSSGSLSKSEVNVLYDLYNATHGDSWSWRAMKTTEIWNFSSPDVNPCNPLWQGLTCDCVNNSTCSITEIILRYYNLSGSIPVSIGNLTHLITLDISYNELSGTIPDTIGDLVHLTKLNLCYNRHEGFLPDSILYLVKLQHLNLHSNNLNGKLPFNLFNSSNSQLVEVYLNNNQFSGPLPWISLPSLTAFDVSYNMLTGHLTSSLCNSTLLKVFILSFNAVGGSLPSQLGCLSQLTYLYLGNNELTGRIPDSVGELSSIREMHLNNNLLSGSVPASITLLQSLHGLAVSTNFLSGHIPPAWFNTSARLVFIHLNRNSFTGPFPVIELPEVKEFQAYENMLTGSISDKIYACQRLQYFDVSSNYLDGSIPSKMGQMVNLTYVVMSYNQLTGSLPVVSSLQRSIGYQVNNNQLSGSVPDSFCHTRLESLDLGYNQLTGKIPECIDTTVSLRFFTVSYNFFSQSIPTDFRSVSMMDTFAINNNILSGALPVFSNHTLLKFYYVQNNAFSGSVHLIARNSSTLQYVDVSDNQLTGGLPMSFFESITSLKSFAAGTNCISGTLPQEICSVTDLIFLDLDGLSTARKCRAAIFPHSIVFTSYTLSNHIIGGIPECLFNMSQLKTLHLSGNSIHWSIPSSLAISDSLAVLSLSHNKLTGSIPSVIQARQWETLDLSYNKLIGNIETFFEQHNENASLVLQVNRLSGNIPHSLLQLDSINILTGNLFGCDFERRGLPAYDNAHDIYQCGSNSFNQASIIWIGFAAIVFGIASLVGFYQFHWWRVWIKSLWDTCVTQLAVLDESANSSLTSYKNFMLSLKDTILALTAGVLVYFIPVYGVLKQFYKTAQHQYAWTVSAAFLSGIAPAILLLLSYMIFIFMLFVLWLKFTSNQRKSIKSVNKAEAEHQVPWSQIALLTVVVLLNNAVMTVVNGAYVIVILRYSTNIIFAAQIAIALFKLMWNDFAVRGMISVSRRAYTTWFKEKRSNSIAEKLRHSSNEEDKEHFPLEIPCMAFIVLFNSIIAPCLATAVVDTNCFYNVFSAPSKVSTQFPTTSAEVECYYVGTYFPTCSVTTSVSSMEVSYDPPFIYSYQCASSILTNYASVYVFMFLMVAFIKPIALFLMTRCHEQLSKDSWIFKFVDVTIYSLLKPANEEDLKQDNILFYNDRVVLRFVNKVAVFVTFGVVFPLMAAVLCVAMLSEVYLNLFMIGRFLVLIPSDDVRNHFREHIGRNCEGSKELFLNSLVTLVVPFAAVFYGFFVFDIYGDKVGAERAAWSPVLLTLTPGLIWMGYSVYLTRRDGCCWCLLNQSRKNKNRGVSNDGSEMVTVVSVVHSEETIEQVNV